MTPSLTALALAALLQAVQFALYSVAAQKQVGTSYAAGPRDEPRPLAGTAGRLQRALQNHFEGLILFAIAVLLVNASGQSIAFTAACAYTYLAARFAYIPAYAFALTPWRSVIWFVGFFATIAMILSTLF